MAKVASLRQYVENLSELQDFADITVENNDEAWDRISYAEMLIDSYVGFMNPFLHVEVKGLAQSGSTTTLKLEAVHANGYAEDYFTYCYVHILGGAGKGQRSRITASSKDGTITFDAVSTTLDNTSFYKIYQPGKFPRRGDADHYCNNNLDKWFKSIPEKVKMATLAQVEYMIEMGDKYFKSDESNLKIEEIGDYNYERFEGSVGINQLIAPKAKQYLKGVVSRVGSFI